MKHQRCAIDGKYRYPTWDLAAHAALVCSRRRGVALRVYECATCGGGFHLTKNPGNPAVATAPAPFTPSDVARIISERQEAK